MVKKRVWGYLKTVLALLAIIILSHQALAAAVGHGAPAISAGMFESGEGRITLSGIGRVILNE